MNREGQLHAEDHWEKDQQLRLSRKSPYQIVILAAAGTMATRRVASRRQQTRPECANPETLP
jgi:hypothetical protein